MGKLPYYRYISDQYVRLPPLDREDLSGKTVLVLGANIGLGFEAAKHFASMNPGKLIIACRNEAKGQEAVRAIEEATGCTTVELRLVDLAEFSSVVAFAQAFEKDGNRLDIFVSNAAMATLGYKTTVDGWESTIQVNDLSTMLVSLLLIPAMAKTVALDPQARPRLVVVSSEAHYWATLSKEELAAPSILKKLSEKEHCNFNAMSNRYGLSKLLNVFFVRELNAKLPENSPITVTAVDPGYCKSSLRRNLNIALRGMYALMEMTVGRSTEEGGRQLAWASLGGPERARKVRAGYVHTSAVKEVSDFALSKEGQDAQRRIWNESVEILTKAYPALSTIIQEHLSR